MEENEGLTSDEMEIDSLNKQINIILGNILALQRILLLHLLTHRSEERQALANHLERVKEEIRVGDLGDIEVPFDLMEWEISLDMQMGFNDCVDSVLNVIRREFEDSE